MKEQVSLQELAAKLDGQMKSRKDYVANSEALSMLNYEDEVVIDGINGKAMPLTPYAHGQLASALNIPKRYYDKMKEEEPQLLSNNVNTWFAKQPEKKRLVRTLDNKVRAVLSDSYRPLDNFDLVKTVVPIFMEKQCEVKSCALTDTKMYIKVIMPELSTNIGTASVNDIVQAGIVISNSEVGAGSVKIEPLIFRLVCLNGLIVPDRSLRKYHVGKGVTADLDMSLLTTEARHADDHAFWLKVRDIVRGSFNKAAFEAIARKMAQTQENMIVNPVLPEVIEVFKDKFNVSDRNAQIVMQKLIEGRDLSQFGLLNATTNAAQFVEDYEEATELERIGGKMIELSPKDWHEIAA